MSKAYEDLTDQEKLLHSTHFPGKMGPRLERMLKAFQHQMDELILHATPIVRESFQVSTAQSGDLTNVGDMLDIIRLVGESDDTYRNRVVVAAETFETVTRDAILELFESLLGKQPYLEEPFHTHVYEPGDDYQPGSWGMFSLIFEIDMTRKSEMLQVASDFASVIATDETIEIPVVDAVSTTTGVASTTTTTVFANDVSSFPSWGEIIIDDEWIGYDSLQTSPHAFLNCVRGLYDTNAATHDTEAVLTEGATKVFIQGTNNIVYSSQSGTTIYVDDGPYDWDTYFDVSYRISGAELESEYNTPTKLGQAISQLEAIGFDFKAAGIRADIFMGMALRSWFSESREVITLEDDWILVVSEINFPDLLTWATSPDRAVYYESAWDDAANEWDGTLWTQAFWNGSSWERIDGPKGWYMLEISTNTT